MLGEDPRVPGGLAVQEFHQADAVVLPPTAPSMPMYMDSPGFAVVPRGPELKVLVPAQRVARRLDFTFDAVTAYMEVSHRGDRPMLGVYHVYSVVDEELTVDRAVIRR